MVATPMLYVPSRPVVPVPDSSDKMAAMPVSLDKMATIPDPPVVTDVLLESPATINTETMQLKSP